jgi:SAM-dependent methyltransferase
LILDYPQRSPELEWMDDLKRLPSEVAQSYEECLRELDRVGRILGGHRASLRVFQDWSRSWKKNEIIRVLDVGCGSGYFGQVLTKAFPQLQVHGVEVEFRALDYARKLASSLPPQLASRLSFGALPGPDLKPLPTFDYCVANLVAHHIPDEGLPRFLSELASKSQRAFLLNDLHRHRVADWSFRGLSRVAFKNEMIRHDGPISVRRAFVRRDFEKAFQEAGLLKEGQLQISWSFPFRWMVRWTRT